TYMYASTLYVFFFFFQAEDGIRDRNVTGVQTCALPILLSEVINEGRSKSKSRVEKGKVKVNHSIVTAPSFIMETGDIVSVRHFRSEERRVGKECRSRWARQH